MATQIDVLNEIAKKLNALRKELCCKLDSVIEASGGSPVQYNVINTNVLAPGDVYVSPEAHTIQAVVIGGADDVANVVVNGQSMEWPVGFNWNQEATTVFEANMFEVESSTATVIVTTTTQS